jgi:tRNA-2-methylthio-N6-dimethylallyladenosine synthase
MNEYDSDKMADVLQRRRRLRAHAGRGEADLILFNTCSVREKAQEKVFSDLGRVKHLKQKGVLIGVGGCVASQEGAAIIKRAPYVDVVFGPQTLHRLPELLAQRAKQARRRWTSASRDREVRPPAARQGGGRQRLRVHHGRLLQVLQLLRGALHPRRRGQPPVRRRAGGGRRPGRPGREGGDAAGAERERLPRPHGRHREIADFALLLEYVADIPGIERIRYTTSHPNEFTRA